MRTLIYGFFVLLILNVGIFYLGRGVFLGWTVEQRKLNAIKSQQEVVIILQKDIVDKQRNLEFEREKLNKMLSE